MTSKEIKPVFNSSIEKTVGNKRYFTTISTFGNVFYYNTSVQHFNSKGKWWKTETFYIEGDKLHMLNYYLANPDIEAIIEQVEEAREWQEKPKAKTLKQRAYMSKIDYYPYWMRSCGLAQFLIDRYG